MPFEYQNGAGFDALFRNQQRRTTRGDGWLEGCQVTVGDAADSIETDVAGGYVRHTGDIVEVDPQAATHPENTSTDPRKDVITIQSDGSAMVREGDPDTPVPDGTVGEFAAIPEATATGGVDAIAIAVVWIPAGASASGDLSADYIEDRRIEAAPSPREPWRVPNYASPFVSLDADEFYAETFAVPGDSYVHLWMYGFARMEDGTRVAWDPDVNIRFQMLDASDNRVISVAGEHAYGEPLRSDPVGGTSDETYRYQLRVLNTSSTDMDPTHGAAFCAAVTVDERPL